MQEVNFFSCFIGFNLMEMFKFNICQVHICQNVLPLFNKKSLQKKFISKKSSQNILCKIKQ